MLGMQRGQHKPKGLVWNQQRIYSQITCFLTAWTHVQILGSQPVWYHLQSHCKWTWIAILEYLLHVNFVLPSAALMFVITEHFISTSLLVRSLSNFRKQQPTFWPCSWCDWCVLGLFAVLDGKDDVCFHSSQIWSVSIENVTTEGFPWIILVQSSSVRSWYQRTRC